MKIFSLINLTATGIACSLSVLGFSALVSAKPLTPVDIELAFILDGSDSISESDFNLQLNAYKNIFTNPSFFKNFVSPIAKKKIAVGVFQFGSVLEQSLDWTLIDSQKDAKKFGNQFMNLTKLNHYSNLGGAIQLATDSTLNNNFDGTHLVFDISSDGFTFGSSIHPRKASKNAFDAGIDAINAIAPSNSDLIMLEGIIGGTNPNKSSAFIVTADSIENYEKTLRDKIRRETVGPPEPRQDPPPKVPESDSLAGLLSFVFIGLGARLKHLSEQETQ